VQDRKQSGEFKSYRDLIAWQKAMDLSVHVMSLTSQFPREELYGLSQQIRKAAVSVPSNIAEGWGRGSTPDYIRFLRIARGSLCEIETQLLIAVRMNYLKPDMIVPAVALSEECSRVLQGLIYSLERYMNKAT